MITNTLILLGAAILVAVLFHSFRLPSIVAFIVAGILVGPSGLGLINDLPQVDILTEVAAVLLMFTVGLEFSFKDLMSYGRPILILGLGQVLITISLFTSLLYFAYALPLGKAVFIALLIAPSSTAVVLKLLHDHRDSETPYGKAAFSVLLMQDIAIIPMMIAIPFLVSRRSMTDSFLDSIFPLLLLATLSVVILYLISKYGLPFILHRVSLTKNREIFFFSIVFICVGSAALMNKVGLSVSLGAFIAGMLLAGSHYGKQATAEFLPLRDAFLSLFFISIGMLIDLSFVATHLHQILLLGTAVIVIKSLILFLLIWMTGNSSSVARAVTALLFQFGEFSFILAEVGRKQNLIGTKDHQYFIAIAVISLIATPLIYTQIGKIMHHPIYQKILPIGFQNSSRNIRAKILKLLSRPVDFSDHETTAGLEDHILIIGYGVAGQSLARVLMHLKINYQIIELNSETVRIHSDKLPIVFGDAANVEILRQAGAERARLVVIVTSGIHMLDPILNSLRQLNPLAKVIARTNYLQDLTKLKNQEHTQFIVSEVETTLEVIKLSLEKYSVEPLIAQELVSELKRNLQPAT